MSHSDSARYDEAGEVKPKGTPTAGTGSVHDPRPHKYPSTHKQASSKESNKSNVNEGRMARRPSGKYRGSAHGFHTVLCTCSGHPCRCRTSEAQQNIQHDNVNQ
jgi:hypothetical protein